MESHFHRPNGGRSSSGVPRGGPRLWRPTRGVSGLVTEDGETEHDIRPPAYDLRGCECGVGLVGLRVSVKSVL
jgi:hypothetical protein